MQRRRRHGGRRQPGGLQVGVAEPLRPFARFKRTQFLTHRVHPDSPPYEGAPMRSAHGRFEFARVGAVGKAEHCIFAFNKCSFSASRFYPPPTPCV